MKLCLSFGSDDNAYKIGVAKQLGVKYAMASLSDSMRRALPKQWIPNGVSRLLSCLRVRNFL